jgi:MFS family permease
MIILYMHKKWSTQLSRRLLPLYIGLFLQSAVFWYPIEKLFMTSIGFDGASIGLMIACYSVAMLLAETPSGILADRWSRKGVLILGSLFLIIAATIGGLSNSIPVFIISTLFWGICYAMCSGTYDSIIYDTLQEEQGNSKQYNKYYGQHKVVQGVALIGGALVGGLIADGIGLRETFFYTIPLTLLSIVFLLRFREPKLHKKEVADPIMQHIAQTFGAVLKNRYLIPVIVSTVTFSVIMDTLLEFDQLWYMALTVPLILYGPFDALLLSTFSIGGLFAKHFHKMTSGLAVIVIIFASIATLIITRNYGIVIVAQVLLGTGLVILSILLSHKLHDSLPSKLRAGSASVISTMSRIIMIPFVLIFGSIVNNHSIFAAASLLLVLAVVGAIAYIRIDSNHKPTVV